MARILIGVTGGIAAYKALELVRLCTGAGHSVRVIQTESSTRFVGPASFEAISGAPVLTTEWESDPARGAFPGQPMPEHEPLNHLELVRNADLYAVVPATANTISKLAAGAADNLLTSCALAATCPIVVAPAMNHHMWRHAATRANVELLGSRGVTIVDPDEGRLASKGEWGEGRLADPAVILGAIEALLGGGSGPWDGLRVLITAGGTREPIDEVRFLGNRSSGRMGVALAQAARRRGADVTLIASNISVPVPAEVTVVPAPTAADLEAACQEEFPDCDLLLMAAAVADFRAGTKLDGKVERGADGMTLDLEATADIVGGLAGSRAPGQVLVAFAAEHGESGEERAAAKRERKGVDAIVVNDIARPDIGFESTENEVTIISADEPVRVPKASKEEVAEAILDFCDRLLSPARRASA